MCMTFYLSACVFLCMCDVLSVQVQMCVCAQRLPSCRVCFTVGEPFTGWALWYVFRAISEQIYWLIIVKQVQCKWEIYEQYMRVTHSVCGVWRLTARLMHVTNRSTHTECQTEKHFLILTSVKEIIRSMGNIYHILNRATVIGHRLKWRTKWLNWLNINWEEGRVSKARFYWLEGSQSEQSGWLLATGANVWWCHWPCLKQNPHTLRDVYGGLLHVCTATSCRICVIKNVIFEKFLLLLVCVCVCLSVCLRDNLSSTPWLKVGGASLGNSHILHMVLLFYRVKFNVCVCVCVRACAWVCPTSWQCSFFVFFTCAGFWEFSWKTTTWQCVLKQLSKHFNKPSWKKIKPWNIYLNNHQNEEDKIWISIFDHLMCISNDSTLFSKFSKSGVWNKISCAQSKLLNQSSLMHPCQE